MFDTQALATLLDKLGKDDAFRARLQADPTAALAEIGVHVPPGLHSGPITLPSKDDVIAGTPQWLEHASSAPTSMAIFFFLK